MKNVSPVEKFEYMERVWLSDLPVNLKNIINFLIKQYREKEGYAWPDTAMLAKVTTNSDSKNVNRLLKKLPADLVTIEYKDGLNNRYFLNWENINKLEAKEVRTNFTKRTQPSSIGRSTLLNPENDPPQSGEQILRSEEPNSDNNSYNNSEDNSDRDAASLTSLPNALSEDSPLLPITEGSVVPPSPSLALINEEVNDLDVPVEDTTVTDPPQSGESAVPGQEKKAAGAGEKEYPMNISGLYDFIRDTCKNYKEEQSKLNWYMSKLDFSEHTDISAVYDAVVELRRVALEDDTW